MSKILERDLAEFLTLGRYKSVVSEGMKHVDEASIALLVIEAFLELGEVAKAENIIESHSGRNSDIKSKKAMLYLTAKCKYLRNDYQFALEVIQEAATINLTETDQSLQGRFLTLKSEILWRQGRLSEALEVSENAISVLEKEKKILCLAAAYNAQGMIYRGLGKIEEALRAHNQALELRNASGNSQYISNSLNNIAVVHWTNGRLKTAIEFLEQAFALKDQIENTKIVANWINNTAIIKETQGAFNEALTMYEEAEFLFQKDNNLPNIATVHCNIGEVNRKLGMLAEAKLYHESALKMRFKIGNSHYIAESLFYLALTKLDQGLPLISTELFRDFPKDPGQPVTVTGFYKMIQGLIAQQNNNWSEASQFWQESLHIGTLEFYFRNFCHEQLVTISFLQWMDTPSARVKEKLYDRLTRWENLCRDNALVPGLCKVHLIRAKLETAVFNNENAMAFLKSCLDLARENDLIKYKELAELEIQRLRNVSGSPQNIGIVERKRLEQDHLEDLMVYLRA